MMNDNLDQDTKNFLSDLAVLLSDHHVISLSTDYDTVRFVFDDASVISFDRYVDNKLINLKSIKYFSDYVPKCMRDMPAEAINIGE